MARNPERMRYQSNKAAFLFCILALFCNVLQIIVTYEGKNPEGFVYSADYQVGADTLINIALMLTVFLSAEKNRTYHKNWATANIILAVVQILRIFFIPLKFLSGGQMAEGRFIFILVLFLISAASLIAAAVITYIRATVLNQYLEKIGETV